MFRRNRGKWEVMEDKGSEMTTKARAEAIRQFYRLVLKKKIGLNGEKGFLGGWITGMTADPNGNVYIAEQESSSIWKFDSELVSIDVWANNRFSEPSQMAVLGDMLYVTDLGGAAIHVFDLERGYKGPLNLPSGVDLHGRFGIATHQDGWLYVFHRDSAMLYLMDASGGLIGKSRCDLPRKDLRGQLWYDPKDGVLYVSYRTGVIYDITDPDRPEKAFSPGQNVPTGSIVDFSRMDGSWFFVNHLGNLLVKSGRGGRYFAWKNRQGWLLRLLHANDRMYVATGEFGAVGSLMMFEI